MGNTFAAERPFCVRLLSSSPDSLNNPITADKLVPVADMKWGSQARALGCSFRRCTVVGQVIAIMEHSVYHDRYCRFQCNPILLMLYWSIIGIRGFVFQCFSRYFFLLPRMCDTMMAALNLIVFSFANTIFFTL